MKYRKVRIAWSVAWAIVSLSLIVFWVCSYWWYGSILCPLPSQRGVHVKYAQGQLAAFFGDAGDYDFDLDGSPILTRGDQTMIGHTDSYSHFISWRGFHRGKDSIYFPMWFPVAVTAAFAALPWLRWRFSLRTLLIGMTAIAVVLGLVIWAAR